MDTAQRRRFLGSFPPGLSPLNPNLVSNLVQWNKGSSITGIANGNPVSSWPATTGTALTQALAIDQPTYLTSGIGGNPGVSFDGVKTFLAASFVLSQPLTFFLVSQLNNNTTTPYAMCDGAVAQAPSMALVGRAFSTVSEIQMEGADGGGSTTGVDSFKPMDKNPHVFETVWNSTSSNLWVDGSQYITNGNAGVRSPSGLTLGSCQNIGFFVPSYENGVICEAALYSRVLTATERFQVRKGLGNKYNIGVS